MTDSFHSANAETCSVQAPSDPMNTPLPCDVTVGHVTMKKGVALRVLVDRMQVLYDMARPPIPERAVVTFGGRCQRHLEVFPCQQCLVEFRLAQGATS